MCPREMSSRSPCPRTRRSRSRPLQALITPSAPGRRTAAARRRRSRGAWSSTLPRRAASSASASSPGTPSSSTSRPTPKAGSEATAAPALAGRLRCDLGHEEVIDPLVAHLAGVGEFAALGGVEDLVAGIDHHYGGDAVADRMTGAGIDDGGVVEGDDLELAVDQRTAPAVQGLIERAAVAAPVGAKHQKHLAVLALGGAEGVLHVGRGIGLLIIGRRRRGENGGRGQGAKRSQEEALHGGISLFLTGTACGTAPGREAKSSDAPLPGHLPRPEAASVRRAASRSR